jgi:hypothetical protein
MPKDISIKLEEKLRSSHRMPKLTENPNPVFSLASSFTLFAGVTALYSTTENFRNSSRFRRLGFLLMNGFVSYALGHALFETRLQTA